MTSVPGAIPVNFVSGEVIYHHWDENRRLVERVRTFRSLDELLALCLARQTDIWWTASR